jgi:hypothetical protein
MYALGLMLSLSLIYLLVAGKGAGALSGIVNVLVGGVRAFIAPVDPVAAAEGALGASPIIAATAATAGAAAASSTAKTTGPGRLFSPGEKVGLRRTDQGRDVQLAPGAGIYAPGAGEVLRVASDPTGFGPDYPIERFTSGPFAGKDLYLGHTDTALKSGTKFKAGQLLARTSRTGHNAPPGWAEIGFAPGGTPGSFGQTPPF